MRRLTVGGGTRTSSRASRLFSQPMEVAVTALVFVGLHRMRLLGPLPTGLLLGILVAAGLASGVAQRRWGPGCTRRQLHLRLGVEVLGTTAAIYSIGWGPTLALGYVVIITDDLRLFGSAVWRPAAVWAVAAMAAGQVAVALGTAPTYVARPYVHGLAALAALGLVFIVRLLGLKTRALEEETAERARAEEAVRRSERRFRSLVQNSSDVVTVVDLHGGITYVSPSVEHVMGFRPDEFMEHNGFDYIHPEDQARSRELLDAVLAEPGSEFQAELRSLHADGTWHWHQVVIRNLLDDPDVLGVVANHRDVTERVAYQERLAHEARHDPLTGLSNRKAFLERLDQALSRGRRRHVGVAVLFVDLDRFKLANDSLGHALGDRLLAEVGRRLHGLVRNEDTVARLGGDEFSILLEDVSDVAGPTVMARRLADQLHRPIRLGGQELVVTASIGVAVSPHSLETAEELLCQADLAMYASKEGGRARASVFDRSATPQFLERLELEAGLRTAVERGELVLHYQPVVGLPDGGVAGMEALLRWQHPTRGLLAPASFMPLAEETGLIVPVGTWVLEEACRTMGRLKRGGCGPVPSVMSVNVSAVQLREPGFPETVSAALTAAGLAPEDLVLEITEGVMLQYAGTTEVVSALHDLGVGLALDDFGTGYSSLAYLRHLPLDYVKIDRSFVAELCTDEVNAAIIRAVAALAEELGLVVVAEGVESREQAERLTALGCRLAQGYHFGPPGPLAVDDEVTALATRAVR